MELLTDKSKKNKYSLFKHRQNEIKYDKEKVTIFSLLLRRSCIKVFNQITNEQKILLGHAQCRLRMGVMKNTLVKARKII